MRVRLHRFLLCIAILVTPCSTFAKIGQTYPEVTAKFGQPLDSVIGEKQYVYHSNGMKIVVTFVDNISQCEVYSPLEPDHKFTARETGMILGYHTDGLVGFTKAKDSNALLDNFISDDGKLFATLVKDGPLAGKMIMVCTQKWLDMHK